MRSGVNGHIAAIKEAGVAPLAHKVPDNTNAAAELQN